MKIQSKLFLLLTGFSFVLLTAFVILMQWSIGKGMVEYANAKEAEALQPLVSELQQIYIEESGWNLLSENPRRFRYLLDSALRANAPTQGRARGPEHRPPPRGHGREPRPPHNIDDASPRHQPPPRGGPGGPHRNADSSYMLVDHNKVYLVGLNRPELEYGYTPIEVNNQIVGYFAISKRSQLTQGYELDFVEQQTSVLYISALGMTVIVLLFTLPLARHLLAPIRALAVNIHSLTQGNFATHDYPERKDELGQLQTDQNNLALALRQNEQARKQWLANTSHELRTPIAILKGELEAIIDGIRGNTPENLESLLQEVHHLQSLIDDLQQLNQFEMGGITLYKESVDLCHLVQRKAEGLQGYLAANQMTLALNLPTQVLMISADATRINQVIENICQNSVKYAGPNHQIDISIEFDEEQCQLVIADDGEGVPEPAYDQLFDYLYRVESSRNRKLGGSGLGLAICRHIVEGHHGKIAARSSAKGGLAIVMTFAIETKEAL